MHVIRLFFGPLVVISTQVIAAGDSIVLPPSERVFRSPNGEYELRIYRPEHLQPGRYPYVVLEQSDPDGSEKIKTCFSLNIYVGPRFAYVDDQGFVVFIDEWLRKRHSDYAVQGFDSSGRLRFRYSTKDVVSLTRHDWPAISSAARYGPWLADAPTFTAPRKLTFVVGEKSIELNVESGELKLQ